MKERGSQRKPDIPDWAHQERQADMGWIGENFHIFWSTANEAFAEMGRGAIVVDTVLQPIPGGGNPFAYFPQAFIEAYDDEDTRRLVREYNPQKEIVVMLLKENDRTSAYRIRLERQRKKR